MGGQNSNTATFAVNVGVKGNHAVNVAYITCEKQFFIVRVNNNTGKNFELISSGLKCDKCGKSYVLPIELGGFVVGVNNITFGVNDTTIEQPFLEWISVV